ncbi:MAG TPA: alpha/beta hydrolase [Bacillota bacterium]|nr:alpha/beta hydrolase [Bacillota bacterium]
MERTSQEKIMAIKGRLRQSFGMAEKTVEQIRREEAALAAKIPMIPGITIEKTRVANMAAERVGAESILDQKESVILYIHGGGFISGSCDSHRDIAARIVRASETPALVFEYRLAPEHRYPAANEDCLAAYRWLVEGGVAPQNIILGGDSTGGYLALMTLLALRDAGEPLPGGAFLLSPHTDFLYYDGESYESRVELDPIGSLTGSQMCANSYFDPVVTDPAILAPFGEDLKGLPSLLIQVGDHEVILSDSTRLAERAKEAGVEVTLEIWDNMWHTFRFMAYMLPEGAEAIESIGRFVRKQLE